MSPTPTPRPVYRLAGLTLALIALSDGFAIVVRAARNLVRPAHFFAPLKQGNPRWLRGVTDDFWATFVEPSLDDPSERAVTIYGAAKVNPNEATPLAI